MSTTDMGRVAEAKVISKITELGWYPFIDVSGKCPVDLLAWKNNRVIRIQVKYTGYAPKNGSGKYVVQVGSTRPNRTGNVIHKFDPSKFDYLAVYLQPRDLVMFIPTSRITVTRALTISDEIMMMLEIED